MHDETPIRQTILTKFYHLWYEILQTYVDNTRFHWCTELNTKCRDSINRCGDCIRNDGSLQMKAIQNSGFFLHSYTNHICPQVQFTFQYYNSILSPITGGTIPTPGAVYDCQ